jgi:CheY-like chemotaxis protein
MKTDRGHILVVDDDDDLRTVTLLILGDHGFDVAGASSGSEALAYVTVRRPSLILLDMMMPTMNGLEVMQRLQKDEALRDIPVVLMTASPDRPGRFPGAVGVIRKPVDANELRIAVDQFTGAD